MTLTLEERVEQLKARIDGFKLRYSYLYPPEKPEQTLKQNSVQAPAPPKPNKEMNDLRNRLRGVK